LKEQLEKQQQDRQCERPSSGQDKEESPQRGSAGQQGDAGRKQQQGPVRTARAGSARILMLERTNGRTVRRGKTQPKIKTGSRIKGIMPQRRAINVKCRKRKPRCCLIARPG
jgi:hypothetical protein